ncbi:hypothetical protein D3C84_1015350 [compost metagenome]
MRKAAVARSALRETMVGDLPPSSRVTGTRLSAALRITTLPMAVLPVNTRWSKGWRVTASAISAPPTATPTTKGSKCSAQAAASTAAVRGAISEGLRIARLPAASTKANGLSRVNSGAFQVPMMPTEPLGW